MSPVLIVGLIGVVIFAGVLFATVFAITKGYNYKHSVDPLPHEDVEKKDN